MVDLFCFLERFYPRIRPVFLKCASVFTSPYLEAAAYADRKPSPYTGDASVSIWCRKNSPKRLLAAEYDRFAFAIVLGFAVAFAGAVFRLDLNSSSLRSHMCAITWQMPSSTSFSRFGKLPGHIQKPNCF